jgi:hypothetical protein
MPWTARDAYRHTKKASTPDSQNKWAKTANAVLEQSGDEGKAVRVANAPLENTAKKPTKPINKRK